MANHIPCPAPCTKIETPAWWSRSRPKPCIQLHLGMEVHFFPLTFLDIHLLPSFREITCRKTSRTDFTRLGRFTVVLRRNSTIKHPGTRNTFIDPDNSTPIAEDVFARGWRQGRVLAFQRGSTKQARRISSIIMASGSQPNDPSGGRGDDRPDNNTEDRHDAAPDLRILGDRITLQPSGYVEPAGVVSEGKEEALMKNMARFRSEPLRYVILCSSLHHPNMQADIAPASSVKCPSMFRGRAGALMTTPSASPSSTRASRTTSSL
jgi:hypothetical protein